MTDEELCDVLRLWNWDAAADRIEALVGEMTSGSFYKEDDIDRLIARAEAAEAALKKLVAAAKAYRDATRHLMPCPETAAGLDAALREVSP